MLEVPQVAHKGFSSPRALPQTRLLLRALRWVAMETPALDIVPLVQKLGDGRGREEEAPFTGASACADYTCDDWRGADLPRLTAGGLCTAPAICCRRWQV